MRACRLVRPENNGMVSCTRSPRLSRNVSHKVTIRSPLMKAGVTRISTSQAKKSVKAASQPNCAWFCNSPVTMVRKPSASIVLVSVTGRNTASRAISAAAVSEPERLAAPAKRAR